jgi:hypothetical protein
MVFSRNIHRLLNQPKATILPITSNYSKPITSAPTMPPYSMNVDPEWLNTFAPTKAAVKELTTDDANNSGMQALDEELDAWFADSNIAVFVSTAVTHNSHMVTMRLRTSAANCQDRVNRWQG